MSRFISEITYYAKGGYFSSLNSHFRKSQLQDACSYYGLSGSGVKEDLADRLISRLSGSNCYRQKKGMTLMSSLDDLGVFLQTWVMIFLSSFAGLFLLCGILYLLGVRSELLVVAGFFLIVGFNCRYWPRKVREIKWFG